MAKEPVTVRLDPELIETVDLLAERLGDSRSGVIQRAVVQGLESLESAVDIASDPLANRLLRVVARLQREEDRRETLQALDNILSSVRNEGTGSLFGGVTG